MPAERTQPGYVHAFLDWLESSGGAGNAPKVDDKPFTMALDYDASGRLLYHGMSLLGTSKAAAAWQIKKLTYDVNGKLTDIQYGNGVDTFTNVWNNRTTIPYS
jgi:hypothetical protein